MGDGTTVSTTPMEWRSRVRAAAQARPVVFHERDIGQRLLLMREQLKGVPRKERTVGGRAKSSLPRQMRDLKAK
jgi:hypothetical protein